MMGVGIDSGRFLGITLGFHMVVWGQFPSGDQPDGRHASQNRRRAFFPRRCLVSGLIGQETSFASILPLWPNRLAGIASAKLDYEGDNSPLHTDA
jgi:hypothetical protein